MDKLAQHKMVQARTTLVINEPFFGGLSLKLKLVEAPNAGTAYTNGEVIGYNPEFINGLDHDECVGLIAHEVMHCALGHPWRRDGRKPGRWNRACDMVINPQLEQAGMKLPEGGLRCSSGDEDKSAEYIYNQLPDDPDDPGSGWGEIADATGPDQGQKQVDWQVATIQAIANAKAAGQMSGDLRRLLKKLKNPDHDWKAALWRFAQESAREDYSWASPNKRHLPRGLYLPSLSAEGMGELVMGIDTSGSIDDHLLAAFATELEGVLDMVKPESLRVIYCDTKVTGMEVYQPGDPLTLDPKGGGGTDFRPVFDLLEEQGIKPAAMVYFTDLEGAFPEQAPDYPVLWAAYNTRLQAPFGETILLNPAEC